MKRISIVGLGYIGLPTAIVAAQAGYDVYGFDTNSQRVKNINEGNPPLFEPELTDRLWKVLKDGNFKAFTDLQYADCFVIAVPTPFKEDNKADLRYVFQAGDAIAKRLMPGNLVILESTVPVGTTERLAQFLEEASGLKMGIDFFISHCPERVLPGKIFKELIDNDRIIGGICQESCRLSQLFYTRFVKGFLHVTDDKSAEMCKLVENASRDVQIAFANQVAQMCNEANIDPYEVIELANKHPRVKILNPTCGVGGHCIAVDPWFLIESFPASTKLLQTARTVNDNKPKQIIDLVLQKTNILKTQGISKPRILALGLTFKPDVDDIRNSPALDIAQSIKNSFENCELLVYEKNITKEAVHDAGLEHAPELKQATAWADIVLVLVKHREFTLLHEDYFERKIVIDTCGLMHEIQNKQSRNLLDGATKLEGDFWKKNLQQAH